MHENSVSDKKMPNLRLIKGKLIQPANWFFIFIVSLFYLFATSCINKREKASQNLPDTNSVVSEINRYARGFSITKYGNFDMLEVKKPWQGSEQVNFKYLLVKEGEIVPDSIRKGADLIRMPIERIVCTSTTHVAMLDALGKTNAIVGVSGSDLITNKEIKERIKLGEIRDIGYGRELNYEVLVSLRPDVVLIYGVESEMTGLIHKLKDLGISVLMNGEYLEEDPLGKMEWIKLMATLFGLGEKATVLFDSVATRYELLKSKTESVNHRPVVLTGLPWKDVWYVSPGNTANAKFIEAAGATYLWEDLESEKAIPMDLESVYLKAGNSEYWINTGTARSIDQIVSMDSRFSYFPPVSSGKVYNNIARVNATGGNDYWESGLMHPDIILRDLISIFHPELLGEQALVYYQKLQP
ncbi:MAG: iron ABC transporter substrate-binding protein [Bacteroidetes bacterium]|nr:MAG: iron ABC transporter substrate-binding protein [Bacteroidota bacterium]